jgi:DNA-binding CsgD family transcriptional regulator
MEPTAVDISDLYAYVRGWSRTRLQRFPRWTFDDIAHEALLVAREQIKRHDPARSAWWNYLEQRLWEPMHRAYAKQHGMRITREFIRYDDGSRKYQPRQTVQIERQHTPMPEQPYHHSPKVQVNLGALTRRQTEVALLLSRGYSRADIAKLFDVSVSAVCLLARQIRHRLKGNT